MILIKIFHQGTYTSPQLPLHQELKNVYRPFAQASQGYTNPYILHEYTRLEPSSPVSRTSIRSTKVLRIFFLLWRFFKGI